jgi:hypothetical protein
LGSGSLSNVTTSEHASARWSRDLGPFAQFPQNSPIPQPHSHHLAGKPTSPPAPKPSPPMPFPSPADLLFGLATATWGARVACCGCGLAVRRSWFGGGLG